MKSTVFYPFLVDPSPGISCHGKSARPSWASCAFCLCRWMMFGSPPSCSSWWGGVGNGWERMGKVGGRAGWCFSSVRFRLLSAVSVLWLHFRTWFWWNDTLRSAFRAWITNRWFQSSSFEVGKWLVSLLRADRLVQSPKISWETGFCEGDLGYDC